MGYIGGRGKLKIILQLVHASGNLWYFDVCVCVCVCASPQSQYIVWSIFCVTSAALVGAHENYSVHLYMSAIECWHNKIKEELSLINYPSHCVEGGGQQVIEEKNTPIGLYSQTETLEIYYTYMYI